MPMIDVYAAAGTFADKHRLARTLAATLMAIEGVPDIPMFRQNTAAFVHELPAGDISNVDGASGYVRVQVLTNAGALGRAMQIPVVSQFTSLIADAAEDPALADRTRVLLTEAVPGGWGLSGHANMNDELVAAARKQIAEPQGRRSPDEHGRYSTYVAYMCRLCRMKLTGPLERVLRVLLADPTGLHYGYDLMKAARLASGTLYPMLARLQQEGLVDSQWEDQRPDASGRPPRRYYRLTAEGARVARLELAHAATPNSGMRQVAARPAPGTSGSGL